MAVHPFITFFISGFRVLIVSVNTIVAIHIVWGYHSSERWKMEVTDD